MFEIIDKEIVNSGRQKELDLAKGIAIILLVFCHVGIYLFEESNFYCYVSDIMGGEFAAPVFMVCLGVGTVYSKHNEVIDLVKRGIKTLFYGYLLNFCREGIFIIIGNLVGKPYSVRGVYYALMMVDIMQFAGMAFLALALFKKLKIHPAKQFMIGILCAGLGEILAWKSLGNMYLDSIFGLIWGTYSNTYFPLLDWIVFPCAGVFFGELLLHCNDKSKLYKSVFYIGLIGVALTYYQIFGLGIGTYYNNHAYYFMGIKNVVFALCFPITLFSICQYIADKTIIEDLPIVGFCSKNLNSIYCVSWVVIFAIRYTAYDVLNIKLSNFSIILLMFVVLFISYEIVKVYTSLKLNVKSTKTGE